MRSIPHGDVTYRVLGAAFTGYNTLGSGFNEAIYDRAMRVALDKQGLAFESQKAVEIFFEGTAIALFYLDFLVEERIVVEVKALPELNSSHIAQTITYLTDTGCHVALLINFGTNHLEWRRVLPPMRVQARRRQEQM